MLNSNSSAGTAADSSTQPLVNSSADIEANPMLGAGFQVFNINHHVFVKIKEEGFVFMKEKDDKWLPTEFQKPIEHYKERVDKFGFVKFQMWEFMRMFGSSIGMGFEVKFDTNIVFNVEDFTAYT